MFYIKTFALAAAVAAMAMIGTADAQTKIKIGRTLSGSGFHVPIYIAFERGFFKKEGLSAEYVSMTGKALVPPAFPAISILCRSPAAARKPP